ncbi:hypothetical protein MMC18_006121 [Xylographa bjoerkii]|nr:hypothetical protein [Xylographa bjoerkii]
MTRILARILTTHLPNFGLYDCCPDWTTVTLLYGDICYFIAEINGIYSAAILQPILDLEAGGTDIWDNPRIPLLEELEAKEEPDADGWYDTIDSTMWSSTIGVPLQAFHNNRSYEFTMQSSYIILDCPFPNATSMSVIKAAGPKLTATPSQSLFMSITPPNNAYPGNITFVS